jgi:hypothetical protein
VRRRRLDAASRAERSSWLKMGERRLNSKLLAAPRARKAKSQRRLQLRSRGSTMAWWCSHAQKSKGSARDASSAGRLSGLAVAA